MTAEQSALLKKIMSYDFALTELTLFLDTHPTDTKALEMYKAVVEKAKALKNEYQEKYGPLNNMGVQSDKYWTWIESPWPWENK